MSNSPTTPAVDNAHTVFERQAERSRLRARVLAKAEAEILTLHRSMTCQIATVQGYELIGHATCIGPKMETGTFGCICECHDLQTVDGPR